MKTLHMSRITRIEKTLHANLSINYLLIEDESHNHNVPSGAESHFKIIAASQNFNQLNLVARHQELYKLLKNELDNGLHALSLFLYTPEEWSKKNGIIPNSPTCRNGGNK